MTERMRIGINAVFLLPEGAGGTWTYLRSLMRELPALDETVEYLIFTNRENSGKFDIGDAPNVREIACPVRGASRLSRLAYMYGVLPIQARRQGIDLLFSPALTAPPRFGYASVLTIHDVQHEDLPQNYPPFERLVFARLFRRSARSAAQILTVSEHTKRRIEAVYSIPPDRITVTYEAADPRFFARVSPEIVTRMREQYGLGARYILAVGQLHPHKNLDVLLDAFARLRETTAAPVQLALVGQPRGAAGALEGRIRAAGLGGEVILTGWVPDADLPALYQGTAVFALPSRYEGFGLPVLEAMASGAPVVTTTATALPEVAGGAALLVEPDDAAGLAGALGQVLGDAGLREGMVGRGRERAAQFTWRKTAELTLSVLRRVAQDRAASCDTPIAHKE